MERASSLLSEMPTNKVQVQTFVEKVKSEILNGSTDPLQAAVFFKSLEDVVKALRTDKEIEAVIQDEAEKHGKAFELHGAKLQLKETGVKYDYNNCEDTQYNELQDQMIELKANIKARETVLKAHKETWFDQSTGAEIKPAIKTSSTKLTVTLK